MTDDFEGRVRATLRQKAAEVRVPSGDAGLDAIHRKLASAPAVPARRTRGPWLVAAAAAVVVAIVGGSLVARNDDDRDRTVVAGGGDPVAGGEAAVVDAVWPSDDPEILRGISAAWARDPSPLPAVRLYLQDRLDTTPSDEHLVVDGDTVTVTEETDVVVHLGRLDGEIWFVERATSGLLDVDVDFDGERVTGGVVPGSSGTLEISYEADDGGAGGTVPAQAEVVVPIDYSMPASDSVVTRVKLLADVGTVALDERRLAAPDGAPVPDAPIVDAVGVWPKGIDEISASDLTDPVGTAARYIEETVGASNGIVLSDFRQGDSNSGEVEVTGDLVATIAVRQVGGSWHVEAVHTPLVEARGDIPGELWLHANQEGVLSVTVLDRWGTVVQSMPSRRMGEGEEVVVVEADPVHKPFSVRYRFEPSVGNPPGIGDVAVAGTVSQQNTGVEPEAHDVPAEALYAGGGLDPIGTAQGYIEDRLGFWPDDMQLSPEHASETIQTVDWSGGSVTMVRHDGYWYVIESFGPVVKIESVDLPRVQLEVGEPGSVHVQALDAEGNVCAETSVDVDGGGPLSVDLGHIPCDPASIVAVLNETIAERQPS
jgi:hypothetical protein